MSEEPNKTPKKRAIVKSVLTDDEIRKQKLQARKSNKQIAERRKRKEESERELRKFALAKDLADMDANMSELFCIKNTIDKIDEYATENDTDSKKHVFEFIDVNGVRRNRDYYVSLYNQYLAHVKWMRYKFHQHLLEAGFTEQEIREFISNTK